MKKTQTPGIHNYPSPSLQLGGEDVIKHGSLHSLTKFFLVLFVLGTIILLSCNPDTDKDGIPDDKDKCPAEYAKRPGGCQPEQKINAVRFFIDRSGSMSGYYRGETEFVNANDDLLAKVESIRTVKEIWLVSDSAVKFNGNADAFRRNVLRTQPTGTKSSRMDDIFKTIAARTDTNDISVFISDGILSHSDQEIKRNKNINKEKAKALGTDIFIIFNKLRKYKDFGASLYAFRSSFNGTYYSYRNDKIRLSGEQRPYYIWVLGRSSLLNTFNKELSATSTFQPLEQLHFGLDTTTVTKASFISSFERAGSWQLNSDGTGLDEIGKASRFCIALDLSTLPSYARTIAYLKKQLRLDTKGCVAALQVKEKNAVDITKLRSNRQKQDVESATHLLVVDVTQMKTSTATLNIVLPAIPDTWYQSWSCEDDINLKKTCPGQTFAFHYLIDGMIQAYQANNKSHINIAISLQQ